MRRHRMVIRCLPRTGIRRCKNKLFAKVTFYFRLIDDDQRPDANGQTNNAAWRKAGDHGYDTRGHTVAETFELSHFHRAIKNVPAKDQAEQSAQYASAAGHGTKNLIHLRIAGIGCVHSPTQQHGKDANDHTQ